MSNLLFILTCLLTLIISLIIIIRNQNIESRSFGLLVFTLCLWLSIQYAAVLDSGDALQWTRIGLVLFSFVPYLQNKFLLTFIGKGSSNKAKLLSTVLLGTLILLSIYPRTLMGAHLEGTYVVIDYGLTYIIHSVITVLWVLYSLFYFIFDYRKLNKARKIVSRYLVVGVVFALIGNTITGLIYPNVSTIQFLGPLSILAMSMFFIFAIGKYKLFDVRTSLLRSISYWAILFVASGLILVLLVLAVTIFPVSEKIKIVLLLLLVLVFITFAPALKLRLDKLANKYLFTNSIDPRYVYDLVNEIIIGSMDKKDLIAKIKLRLPAAINCENINVVTIEETRFVDTSLKHADAQKIAHFLQKNTDINSSRASFLQKEKISEIIALKGGNGLVGWMEYGNRNNGGSFQLYDRQVLKGIAEALVIGLESMNYLDQLEKLNMNLQQEIEQATSELKKSNKKLLALDEAKDEFISMASHQLRTPLTSIKGYLSMVLEGDVGSITDQQRKMLSQAFISSQRMVYLIADLLNVSRLQTGKFIIETKECYLPDVIEEEINQIKETAEAKGIKLVFNKPNVFPRLALDETKIRQVIMNFVDNAVYYGKSGGEIKVNLKETGSSIEFTVVDNGIGVPKADQHKLFTKFYRAGNARKARPDGTGLGLYMAQKVVTASGGTIIFKSKEGSGSTFGFTISKSKLKTA